MIWAITNVDLAMLWSMSVGVHGQGGCMGAGGGSMGMGGNSMGMHVSVTAYFPSFGAILNVQR